MNDLTLIMNAAEGRLQLVLAQGATLLCSQDWNAPSKGTELLTPALGDMLNRLEATPASIARIACVTGPGSFTGLRLALTTAAAFRRALGIPLAELNALHALAATIPFALLSETPYVVRVITHARRGLVHGQDFLVETPNDTLPFATLPKPLGEPAMWELATVCAPCTENATVYPRFIMGSGVQRNLSSLTEQCTAQHLPIQLLAGCAEQPAPHALLALTLALPETAWEQRDLDPCYLRPCDAVDNLSSIALKRGQDPEKAHAELERLLTTPVC